MALKVQQPGKRWVIMRGMDDIPYNQKDLLSAEDVARYFGVGQMTVYRWCKEGRLQCIKLGKHWRIRREALEDLLAGARQRAGDRPEQRYPAPPRRRILPCRRGAGRAVSEVLRRRGEIRG